MKGKEALPEAIKLNSNGSGEEGDFRVGEVPDPEVKGRKYTYFNLVGGI
jgi:hypothetical protein